jgi:hypothetical protein
MPQFGIRLPDNVLQADKIESIRSFAKRNDWTGLPSSSHLHAGVISVLLRPPDTDTSMAEKGLLLLASQRIILYLESPSRPSAVDFQLWLSWIDRIDKITTAQDEERDALQLCKDKMQLSIELFEKATSLLHSDKLASEVLYASGSEIGVSADIQTVNDSGERMKMALAVAEIAKLYSFDEQSITSKPSICSKIITNKILAILGIGSYILAVVASATDLDGNLRFPPALILISGTLGLIFIVIATIRLWKESKGLSIFILFSYIVLCILLVIQEVVVPAYGSPLIILTNIAKVIHLIAFVWVIIKLFKTNSERQDA